ncbi:CPBP family intramembrane metalloprotease [Ornithinimicrobium ciconiae]|uniref:CPBP family intramembrane metalloprotease n=1 Tax=Ornithinimicrobium ciconiae TaxID=2594265 RepID=A0A516GEM5_9MICO|nr:CPBP family intramembrane glutamic endopeptidase [Ornithinimicrobium ciconiae]QDO89982.1 CPBP family intramembrane metalloprotease [Ornithinimicrobium ciconiae]
MSASPIREAFAVDPAHGGAVVRFIRRRPLASFFLWTYTVGQVPPWSAMLAGLADRAWLMPAAVVLSAFIGLLLPTLVITRIVDGPEGLRDLGGRAAKIRVGVAWFAAAFLLVPALILAIGVLLGGTPPDRSTGSLLTALGPHFLLPLLITFVLINWWEEVAWMGFVQARLQDRRGPLLAALLVAPLFALQHSSLAAGQGLVPGTVLLLLLLLLAVLAVPFRVAIGWAYNRTGSIFLVGLIHAVGNAATGGDGFNAGYLRHLYPANDTVTMAHLLAMFLLGLLVLLMTRGRLNRVETLALHERPPPAATTAHGIGDES